MMRKITQVLKDTLSGKIMGFDDVSIANEEVEFLALENNKKPGSAIFVKKNGKVGFPMVSSVNFDIGDTVKGIIYNEFDTYFWIEITEVLKKAKK